MPSPATACRPGPHAIPGGVFAIPPRTMLLVEDSRLAAEAVRLICRRIGIRLRRADSLAGAALHLKVYRPDIALIDLGLPDGSGLDLIAALARSSMRPRRLVAVSGEARMEREALGAGADAFLLKPISLAQHFAALTGENMADDDALAEVEHDLFDARRGAARLRNMGADPLALRDDLRLVRDLLTGPADPGRLRYAGQFLASVGRAMRDISLAEAAEAAVEAGDRGTLVDLARARDRGAPVL